MVLCRRVLLAWATSCLLAGLGLPGAAGALSPQPSAGDSSVTSSDGTGFGGRQVADGTEEAGDEKAGTEEAGDEEAGAELRPIDPEALRRANSLGDLALLLPDPTRVHPDVAGSVRVEVSGLRGVVDALATARLAQIDARDRRDGAEARLASLDVQLDLMHQALREARAREATAAERIEAAEDDVAGFAVQAFVDSRQPDLDELRVSGPTDPEPHITAEVGDLMYGLLEEAVAVHDRAQRRTRLVEGLYEQLRTTRLEVEHAGARAEEDLAVATADVERLTPEFEEAVLTAPVQGVDFPLVVLDAYYRGALWAEVNYPRCEVRWNQLAGIGRVESRHGTFGGVAVGSNGVTGGKILGPVLDGTRFASIPDTDGGLHDDDTTWDRAVGPMQFIPGSWKIFGQDGDGDGTMDPHNMYDAAAAAADHLCRRHVGLSARENYRQSLFGYNRSAAYGIQVMALADQYGSALTIRPSDDDRLRVLAFGDG